MTWILNPFFKASAAVVVDSPPSKPSQPQPQPQLLSTHQDRLTTPSSATHTPNTTLPGVNQSTTSNGPETQPDQSVEPEPEVDSHDDVLETESTGSSSGRELRPPTTHVDERAEGQGQVILRLQRPTDKMTGYQFFYIFGLDGIGAMVLSGGINFAIAYAMYATPQPPHPPITLWALPSTLAGDAAVTIILQTLITWLVELLLVNRDLSRGSIVPIGFIRQPSSRLLRWFCFLDRHHRNRNLARSRSGSDGNSGGFTHWVSFLWSQVVRAFLVAVVLFAVFWGPCVGVLIALGRKEGGDWVFEKVWTPEVFKLVLGGLLGLVSTPGMAVFWMVRAGWALRTNLGVDGGGGGNDNNREGGGGEGEGVV